MQNKMFTLTQKLKLLFYSVNLTQTFLTSMLGTRTTSTSVEWQNMHACLNMFLLNVAKQTVCMMLLAVKHHSVFTANPTFVKLQGLKSSSSRGRTASVLCIFVIFFFEKSVDQTFTETCGSADGVQVCTQGPEWGKLCIYLCGRKWEWVIQSAAVKCWEVHMLTSTHTHTHKGFIVILINEQNSSSCEILVEETPSWCNENYTSCC